MKKYLCPFCTGTSCCISNIKKHIKAVHDGYLDHKAKWIWEK